MQLLIDDLMKMRMKQDVMASHGCKEMGKTRKARENNLEKIYWMAQNRFNQIKIDKNIVVAK